MTRTPQCFKCHKFARVEDCVLLRHRKSGNRRWFHHEQTEKACVKEINMAYWEEVDFSLGETTEEEERKLAQLE